jgi:methylated-DNA-[protein]-cysteine S-methyltransferase
MTGSSLNIRESDMEMTDLPKLQPFIKHRCTYLSPAGMLEIAEDDEGITLIEFSDEKEEYPPEEGSHYLEAAISQLKEYFAKERKEFDLPLSLHGTEFQKRVWRALCDIPYGQSASYREIAAAAGDIKAARAVGMANHRNHIVIVIPCHRVIGKDGSLTGYGGGLDKKKYLLDLEGIEYKE